MNSADLDVLGEVERWYYENCDGDWEHSYGLQITTMDNPGWDVQIDVRETVLERLEIAEEYEGPKTPSELLPVNRYDANFDWYKIWNEGEVFRAYCAPRRLRFVLSRFLELAHEAERRCGGYYPDERV